MEGFDFNTFLSTFDFAALVDFFDSGAYRQLAVNPIVLGACGLLVLLIAVQKTREVATMAAGYLIVGLIYGVGGVVLKNSVISQPGPFLLAATLGFGAVGYFVYNYLLKR